MTEQLSEDSDDRAAGLEAMRSKFNDRDFIDLPVPALGDLLKLEMARKKFAVLALPWEPAGETPFHLAQAAAKHGARPLCVFPSWSPYWDGTLNVRRQDPAELTQAVDYKSLATKGDGTGLVIVDQFSRLHWDSVTTHVDREDIVATAGRELLALALHVGIPVLVLVRRKGKGPDMSVADLRSDGALEYDSDIFAMADPDHTTGTAALHVIKDRSGPSPTTTVVDWPLLPRTVYRGARK